MEELKGLGRVDEILFHPGPVAYPGRVLNAIRSLGGRRICTDADGTSWRAGLLPGEG